MDDNVQELDRLNETAAQLYEQGQYEQAVAFAIQACTLTRNRLGEDHPNYATSLTSVAVLYWEMGNYAEAEPLLQQASTIDRDALGADHPRYANDLNNLGGLYREMGNYAEAEALRFVRSIETCSVLTIPDTLTISAIWACCTAR